MASVHDRETFARQVRIGVRALADRTGRKVVDVEGDVATELGVTTRTVQSWKSRSNVPGEIRDDLLLGLAWLVLERGDGDLDWLTKLLRATSVIVPDSPTPDWARACLRGARLNGQPPPEVEIERVVRRLFGDEPRPVDLTPAQLPAYLELVKAAFGHWRDLYVLQEADELRSLEPVQPQRDPGIRRRVYEHVQERPDIVTRERLHVELLDWFLEHGHMALLAAPGCGKSTALEEMAWELADQQLPYGRDDPVLPVLVPLGSYKGEPWPEFLPQGIRKAIVFSLLRFGDWDERGLSREEVEFEASRRVEEVPALLAEHWEPLRQEGRLVLLLDGLNELPGGANGPLRTPVEGFIKESREQGNRVAVTCRIADYTHYIARLHRVELLAFDDDRIHEALLAYLEEEPGHALWKELARPENQKLREMLAIPLYVEVLVAPGVLERDETGRPRLPSNRGAMLDRFARVLSDQEWVRARAAGRPVVDPETLHNTLAEVAYRMRDELVSRGSQKSLSEVQPFLADALAFHPEYSSKWVVDLAAGAKLIRCGSGDRRLLLLEGASGRIFRRLPPVGALRRRLRRRVPGPVVRAAGERAGACETT